MPRFLTLISLVCLLSGCNQPASQKKEESKSGVTNRFSDYLSAHAANQKFNGSVIIAQQDSLLFKEHFGYADRESKIQITDSTQFLIGSITKPFTAMAILLLEQDKKLSLNDPLSAYLPDFPKSDSVTLHQLLTHTSGIRDYHYFQNWKELSQTDITPLDVINQVKTDPYRFEPGTNFRYSNTGYILLGLIIEKVGEKPFSHFIQEAILDPLKLKHTGVIINDYQPKKMARGYVTTPREISEAEFINYNQPFSSGNMYSTIWDLKRFTQAVINSELLPMDKTQEIFENNTGYYGYGWGLRNFDGVKAYGHHGGMNGFWGSITYIPETETFVCFLTNDENTPKYTTNRDLIKILQGDSAALPVNYEYTQTSVETMDRITGDYLINVGDTLHVTSHDERVFMQETGQLRYELFEIGQDRFVMTSQEFDVRFDRGSIYFEGLVNLSAAKLP